MANMASLFLVEWLAKNKSTENLHKVGSSWNWDQGTDILRWIIEQPECDRSTVKLIFLLCPGEDLLRFPSRDKVANHQLDAFDLANRIADLWNSGFYKHAEVKFDPAEEGMQIYRKQEKKYAEQGLPWNLAPDFDKPEGHRVLSYEDFSEGYHKELVDLLRQKRIPF